MERTPRDWEKWALAQVADAERRMASMLDNKRDVERRMNNYWERMTHTEAEVARLCGSNSLIQPAGSTRSRTRGSVQRKAGGSRSACASATMRPTGLTVAGMAWVVELTTVL